MKTNTRHIVSLLVIGLGLAACQFHPVSSSLDERVIAYQVGSIGGSPRLTTRTPVPPGTLQLGHTNVRGPEYVLSEPPPGEVGTGWTRQNSFYYSQHWSGTDEFWYGWMLLDVYSIDRGNHRSPLALESGGVEALFTGFQNDHFTSYYPPSVAGDVGEFLDGTGLDSVFGFFFRAWPRDTLVAARVDPGSAAWQAGLRSDVRLLRFDGRWAATSLGYLRDTARHSPVSIEYMLPATGAVQTVDVIRTPHHMPSLYADTLPGAIGYISISQFVSTEGIATDMLFQEAASWLDEHSKGTWILDLRNNGGGTIESALNLLSALVPAGAPLIKMRSRELDLRTLGGYEINDTAKSAEGLEKHLVGRKILLLQNRGTASSSEIVISALRENFGSQIRTLGDTSYGKGIGQIYPETPLGGYMAVTCLHIDPVAASPYHKVGIAPDDPIQASDSAISKAWNLALGLVGARSRNVPGLVANYAALEWNRLEQSSSLRATLLPATNRRPFSVR